jgi:hypothetical protein
VRTARVTFTDPHVAAVGFTEAQRQPVSGCPKPGAVIILPPCGDEPVTPSLVRPFTGGHRAGELAYRRCNSEDVWRPEAPSAPVLSSTGTDSAPVRSASTGAGRSPA